MALLRGHTVTALVRDPAKLGAALGPEASSSDLSVETGSIADVDGLSRIMLGQDAVINAAGNATVDADYVPKVCSIIEAADRALRSGERFWFFGGAAALDAPGMSMRAADIPIIPSQFRLHLKTLACAERSSLDWSMLCAGPMNPSPSGQPHEALRVSRNIWPVEGPGRVGLLKSVRVLAAFKKRMPEMVIWYEDAAKVILDNLDRNSAFSRSRVGAALPKGLTDTKPLKL